MSEKKAADSTTLAVIRDWIKGLFYQKPSSGIPKTDLASAVQTSLDKADTALQSHQDISGKANVSEAGYALDISGTTISLKNKAGTVLNSQTLPSSDPSAISNTTINNLFV